MNKAPQKPSKAAKPNIRIVAAELEYARLIGHFNDAGVDEIKLKIYDSLIRKVAEVFGILEAMKDLPTLKATGGNTVVTGAGKARVQYMAQYTSSMTKLNRDLMGVLGDPDDDALKEYEND